MNYTQPDSKTIQSIFDSIPERYDLLNTVFSLSLDRNWRKKAAQSVLAGNETSVLDIGVGTGKSIREFLKIQPFKLSVGCDFSKGMLSVAKTHVNGTKLACADLHALPFADESFDIITSSFVLRSVQDMKKFLSEVYRVLTKRGKFVFLDLTRPTNPFIWNFLYQPYLNFYIPLVGKTISRHERAYQFLSQSIQHFVDPAILRKQLEEAGFQSVVIKPLTFGISTLFMGKKERSE